MAVFGKRDPVYIPNKPFVVRMDSDNINRSAQELGLHRQQDFRQSRSDSVEESLETFWYNDYKKRVWINLYTWDRYDLPFVRAGFAFCLTE